MVYNCINIVRSVFFPFICSLCGNTSELKTDLCHDCLADLTTHHPVCQHCGRAITTQHHSHCGKCMKHPPSYDRTHAAFEYSSPLNSVITELKFHGKIQLARVLADAWLLNMKNRNVEIPEALLPVPLHKKRLRQRGYNQALELARPVASHFGIPLLTNMVARVRATTAQTQLTAKQRKKNMRGAFEHTSPIPYRHIAMFDDVVTTGSTVQELASVLKKAGVERVDVWCIARANSE